MAALVGISWSERPLEDENEHEHQYECSSLIRLPSLARARPISTSSTDQASTSGSRK